MGMITQHMKLLDYNINDRFDSNSHIMYKVSVKNTFAIFK